MSDDIGKILQEKYRLVRLLGVGGMASVYEAEHTVIGRKVAVKLLHPRLTDDPTARERMIREAKAAGSIGHPNIVDVQDVGTTEDGAVFIVMEKLDGNSLGELLKAHGRMPPKRAVAILRQLCKGLHAAHEKGIVHRDLKPDNVFLMSAEADEIERVKILDFGISKLSSLKDDQGLTHDGLLVGTPHYMAPEHAEGSQHVDHRCDLWSAGVILYVMLSGELPFPGDNYNAILTNVLFKEPRPLREVEPGIPEALEAIVRRALTRDVTSRYQSAASLLADLDLLVQAEAAAGTPYSASASARSAIAYSATVAVPTLASTPVGEASAGARAPDASPWATAGARAPDASPWATAGATGETSKAQAVTSLAITAPPGGTTLAPELPAPGLAVDDVGPPPPPPDRSPDEGDGALSGTARPHPPGEADGAGEGTRMAARHSLAEHVAWFAVFLPLSWLIWLPAWRTPAFLYHAFSVDESWGTNLARLMLAAVCTMATLLAVAIALAGRWLLRRHWPSGLGLLLLPLVLGGTALYLWLGLEGTWTSHLATLHRYAAITGLQAQRIASQIASDHARLCLAVCAVGTLVWLLASRALLRNLLSGRPGHEVKETQGASAAAAGDRLTLGPGSRFAWIALGGGSLLILLAEVLIFPRWLPIIGLLPGQDGAGLYRWLIYLTWLLCGLAIVRVRSPGQGGAIPGVRTWLMGVVAATSLAASGFAMACARMHTLVGAPPAPRTLADDAMYQIIRTNRSSLIGLLVFAGLLALLFGLLRVGAAGGPRPRSWVAILGRGLLTAVVLALVAAPMPLPVVASRSLEKVYLPHAVSQMHPIASSRGRPPSVYLDKLPRALRDARKPLWAALTGQSRERYREGALTTVLVGYKHCREVLSTALGRAVGPARCVSGVEARRYCEALGMRLPTPAEWDAALGEVPLPSKDRPQDGPFQRGAFGEWTLHVVHDTPAFAIRGQHDASRIPAKLEADAFSPHVGFRCAYQVPRRGLSRD